MCDSCKKDNCGCPQTCNPCCDPCKPPKVNSSTITYDGPDLFGLCIKRGMDFNTILKKIDDFSIQMLQSKQDVLTDTFTDLTNEDGDFEIKLKRVPYRILMVSYCGGVLPDDGYIINGDKIELNSSKYCFSDGNELQVMYQAVVKKTC